MDMNVDNNDVPSEAHIREVLTICAAAINAKRLLLPMSPMERKLDNLRRWFALHAMYAVVTMLVTAGLALYTKSQPMANTMLTLGIIAQLLSIAMMLPTIVSGTFFIYETWKSPFKHIFSFVEASLQLDLAHAWALANYPKNVLQYVLVYYKYERDGYERRSGMLAGTIEKVGIVPAFAGVVLLVANLLKISEWWAGFLGPLLCAFYVLAMASAAMTQKMDRVTALLEFSIQSKK